MGADDETSGAADGGGVITVTAGALVAGFMDGVKDGSVVSSTIDGSLEGTTAVLIDDGEVAVTTIGTSVVALEFCIVRSRGGETDGDIVGDVEG